MRRRENASLYAKCEFVFETLKVKFEAMAQGLLLVIAHTLSKKKTFEKIKNIFFVTV